MADIFISYSRKDAEHALALAEKLQAEGLEVWIDRHGIHGAEHWGGEIVEGIRSCSTFMVLLSQHSIESENVLRELSLATEKRKRVLPLLLGHAVLPSSFEYPLAGLQRVAISDFDAILRAHKHGVEHLRSPDLRKTLMILPFEDLSPTADNGWFADGIVSEMISSLSHVKSLRLIDAQTTKEFRSYSGHLTTYAKEMGIRYFVQGDVRKFGDQIKVSSRLLDIETGDHLWQDSLKGNMDDIFDIQETVAKKVVEGLDIILTRDEKKRVENKPTDNAEAYELFLKGNEHYYNRTRSEYERALAFFEEAIQLDPFFAEALISIANTCLEYYRTYSREERWIAQATEYIARAEAILGESANTYSIRSILARFLGHYEESLKLAEQAVALDPESPNSFDVLGWALMALGRRAEAADALKREVGLRENDRSIHFSYLIALNALEDTLRLVEAAKTALPLYERHLRLAPDDLHTHVQYASILSMAQEHEKALAEARKIETNEALDGIALFNLACLFMQESEGESSFHALEKAIEKGFRSIEHIKDFLESNREKFQSTQGYAKVEEMVQMIETTKANG